MNDADNLRAKEAAMLGRPFMSIFAEKSFIGERKTDGSNAGYDGSRAGEHDSGVKG